MKVRESSFRRFSVEVWLIKYEQIRYGAIKWDAKGQEWRYFPIRKIQGPAHFAGGPYCRQLHKHNSAIKKKSWGGASKGYKFGRREDCVEENGINYYFK